MAIIFFFFVLYFKSGMLLSPVFVFRFFFFIHFNFVAFSYFHNFLLQEFPLISASRYLVKKGEVTEIVSDSNTKNIFKRSKPTKNPLYLFLFNDILLVTKKRG